MIRFKEYDAIKYRDLIRKASENLTDEDAAEAPLLFEPWKIGEQYEVGKRVSYNGVLYKVLQAHTSIAGWTPDAAVSLFAEVLIPTPNIPEWVQPSSTNPYMKGDKVTHNGKTWVSDCDDNVWEPGVYGWSEA